MAEAQAELTLPSRYSPDENEQEFEARANARILRSTEDACDEIGRSKVCYALHISEATLSKKLRAVEDKVCDARIQNYCLKHQKSGRLARVLADYAGFLPFQRPDRIKAEDFARQIAAMALGGEFGAAERQKVLALYEQMERKP